MNTLIDFLTDNLFAICSFIILFVSTLINKKIPKEFQDFMKTFNNRNDTTVSQSFTNVKQEYELDERLNELVESGTTDLQELVNSSRGTSLEELLKRMLPQDIVAMSYQQDYDRCADDLDDLANAFDTAEKYREKFNMPLTASISDIYKRIEEESKSLKNKIEEVSKNAQTQRQNVVQKVEETVQEHSSQGSQEEPAESSK